MGVVLLALGALEAVRNQFLARISSFLDVGLGAELLDSSPGNVRWYGVGSCGMPKHSIYTHGPACAVVRLGLPRASSGISLYVGMLALGSSLVLGNEITPGTMIAASILLARARPSIRLSARGDPPTVADAFRRMSHHLRDTLQRRQSMPLPIPAGALAVEGLTASYLGVGESALHGVSFRLSPSERLGVVGPTAAGKKTLARLLVGILKPCAGHIRLDGADVSDWGSRGSWPTYRWRVGQYRFRLTVYRMTAQTSRIT